MVAIVLAGVVGFRFLPLSALPQVDYPTIQVQTLYPGASPEVMSRTVTAPLERNFGQMSGLQRMSSTSAAGVSIVTLQFGLGTTLDVAEQEVQAAINAGGSLLPADLPTPPIYAKVNPADAPVLTLAITSDTLPLTDVQNLVSTRLALKISQVSGVGQVNLSGGQRPAVRIQADTQALASYGLGLDTLRTAIAAANANSAKGSFDGPTRAYTINANDQLVTASDYLRLIVSYRNGAPVRLADVARVVDSAENVRLGAWADLKPAIILNVQRQPGANVIATVDAIKARLPELQAGLPQAVSVAVLTDRTTGIRASVKHVEIELALAVVLVVLVIFAFLHSVRATVIASLAVPISLVGACGAMYLLGYSLNNLSLMALTIATGFVVDDAIVMIENITRYIEKGMKPLQAAFTGATEIGFTIISLTVSLIAVLIPLLFMGDIVGRLFREFAVTLAITILISAVVSLTLVPMMSAHWLKHDPTPLDQRRGLGARIQRGFDRVIARYDRALQWVLARQGATLVVAVGTLVLTVLLYIVIPKGLFPTQDTGQLQARVEAAPSVSFSRMAELQQAVVRSLLDDPDVASVGSIIGVDAANNTMLHTGRLQINLKSDRAALSTLTERLAQRAGSVAGVTLYLQPTQDLTIDAESGPTQYRVSLEGVDEATVREWANRLVGELRRAPGLRNVVTDVNATGPAATLHHRPRHRLASFDHRRRHRRSALQRVRSTDHLDDLHRDEPVPRDPRSETGPAEHARFARAAAPAHRLRRDHPAVGDRKDRRARGAAADHARRPVSGNDDRLRHGAGRGARRCGRGDPRRRTVDRAAGQRHADVPRRSRGLPGIAHQPALADPRCHRVRLYRARRALRELHPSADDPLDASVGRRRGAARAADRRPGSRRHRHHRHHPADRHREEERDHDDRLRDRRRTQPR